MLFAVISELHHLYVSYTVAAVGWQPPNSSQQAYGVGDQLNRPVCNNICKQGQIYHCKLCVSFPESALPLSSWLWERDWSDHRVGNTCFLAEFGLVGFRIRVHLIYFLLIIYYYYYYYYYYWNYKYMKIIYVNCGVKNYLKEDHRSYIRNLFSCEKKAWKKFRLDLLIPVQRSTN